MKNKLLVVLFSLLLLVGGASAFLTSTSQILIYGEGCTGTTIVDQAKHQNGTLNPGTTWNVCNTTNNPVNLNGTAFSMTKSATTSLNYTRGDYNNISMASQDYSVAVWFYIPALATNYDLYSKYIAVENPTGTIRANNSIATTTATSTSYSNAISATTWTHYLFIRDATNSRDLVYINGALSTNNTGGTAYGVQNADLLFGRDPAFGQNYIGSMAQPVVINASLTSTQVACLYNSGKGMTYSNFTNCVFLNNFTITAFDNITGVFISTFNASVLFNGTTTFYSTTNGTIVTYLVNNTNFANITLQSAGYFNQTNLSINTSSNFVATMQPFTQNVSIWATEVVTNASISLYTLTINTSAYTQVINVSGTNTTFIFPYGTYDVRFNKTNWTNATQYGFVVNASTLNITSSNNSQYALNISARNNLSNVTITSFNLTLYNPLTGWTLFYNTTNGTIIAYITNGTWNIINWSSSGYALTNATGIIVNVTSGVTNYTIRPYTTNSISFYFYDEINRTLLSGITITVQLSGSVYSTNFTTTNGTAYLDLITPGTYTITYGAPGYNQRQYTYVLSNSSTTTLILYLRLSSASSIVLVQVTDQSLVRLSNAFVYVTVKNLSGTNDFLVETCMTDTNGQCLISADISTATYKANTTYRILVVYNNITVGDSGYTILSPTANDACNSLLPCLQIRATIGSDSMQPYYDRPSVSTSLTQSNGNFTYTVNDANGNVYQVCLYLSRRTGSILTLVNSSCSTSASTSITLFANTTLGDETIGEGTVWYSGQEHITDTLSVPNVSSGATGTFTFFLVAMTFFFIFMAFRYTASLGLVMVGGWSFILVRIYGFNIVSGGIIGLLILIGVVYVLVKE